jgi:uncharacterized membrane protein YraQ (UPF0718 family)
MGKQSWRLGRWLLVAFLLEALITMYVPQESIVAIRVSLSHTGHPAIRIAARLSAVA